MITQTYEKNTWVEYGCFSETRVRVLIGMGFTEIVYGAPLRLVVLESSSLAAEVGRSYEKQQKALEPLIKKLTQPS